VKKIREAGHDPKTGRRATDDENEEGSGVEEETVNEASIRMIEDPWINGIG